MFAREQTHELRLYLPYLLLLLLLLLRRLHTLFLDCVRNDLLVRIQFIHHLVEEVSLRDQLYYGVELHAQVRKLAHLRLEKVGVQGSEHRLVGHYNYWHILPLYPIH